LLFFFNWLVNSERLWNGNKSSFKQIILWIAVISSYLLGLILTSLQEFEGKFENFGWFLCYLFSTFPLPMISVIFQSLIRYPTYDTTKQGDMLVYSKRSLIILMLNVWQLIWLLIFIGLIPTVDGTSIIYSIRSGLDCTFYQNTSDNKDTCGSLFLVLLALTLCVIYNFYAGMKVITFDDANFAILIQQLGPIVAAFVFSSEQFMGRWYDNEHTTWKSYVAIALISLSFYCYKVLKVNYLKRSVEEPENLERQTLFERLWIIDKRIATDYIAVQEQ